jgi:excisionase family DNA binding protein
MLSLEDRLYTSSEVAELVGVSLRSIYRYLDEGKLTAEVKTATGRHRFTRNNILDFLYPERSESAPINSSNGSEEKPSENSNILKKLKVLKNKLSLILQLMILTLVQLNQVLL